MVRILGVVLENNKQISLAFTKIFGIGKKRSFFVLNKLNIKPNLLTENLNFDQIDKLTSFFEENEKTVETNLRRSIYFNLEREKTIKSYKGYRYIKELPVRGQRTRTNSRTTRLTKKPRNKNIKSK